MNNKIIKLSVVYISIIILAVIGYILFSKNLNKGEDSQQNQFSNNVDKEESDSSSYATESTKKPKSLEGLKVDPISGQMLIRDTNYPAVSSAVPGPKSIDSVFFLGSELLYKDTLLDGEKILRLTEMYNLLAKERSKTPANPLDVRIYKGSIGSSQTNETVTYTFKTYIDGENYYSIVTYDIDNKMNLKILTEDKSKVLHEYNR